MQFKLMYSQLRHSKQLTEFYNRIGDYLTVNQLKQIMPFVLDHIRCFQTLRIFKCLTPEDFMVRLKEVGRHNRIVLEGDLDYNNYDMHLLERQVVFGTYYPQLDRQDNEFVLLIYVPTNPFDFERMVAGTAPVTIAESEEREPIPAF